MQNSHSDRAAGTSAVRSKPLVSHTSILIISVFLIGMVSGQASHKPLNDMQFLLAGVFGLVAYLGLGRLALIRQRRAAQLELEEAQHVIERRMERHLSRETEGRADFDERAHLPYQPRELLSGAASPSHNS